MNLKKLILKLFTSNLVVSIISFLYGILSVKYLSIEDRGEYYLVNQYLTIITITFLFSLPTSLQFHISSKLISILDSNKIWIIFSWYMLPFLTLFLTLSNIYFEVFNLNILLIGLILLYFNILNSYFNSILMINKEAVSKLVISNVIQVFTNLFLFILTSFLTNINVEIALIILIFSYISKFIYLFIKGFLTFPISKKKTEKMYSVLKFSLQNYIFTLFFLIYTKYDILFLSRLIDKFEFGIYSFAIIFSEIPIMLATAFGTALFATLPGKSKEEKKITTIKATSILFIIVSITALLVKIIIPYLLIMFDTSYNKSIEVLNYLLVSSVFLSLIYPMANYLVTINKQLTCSLIFFIGLLLKILISLNITGNVQITMSFYSLLINLLIFVTLLSLSLRLKNA